MKKKLRVLLSILGVSTLALMGAGCTVSDKLQTGVDQLFCKHEYSEFVVKKNATCTEKGEKTRTCAKCAKEDKESIEKIEHIRELVPAIKATCTTAGVNEHHKCKVCNEIILGENQTLEDLVDPAKGHVVEVLEGKSATCTDSGITEGKKCTTCGEVLVKQENINAKGHTFVKVDEKTATCTEDGHSSYTYCSVDGCNYSTEKVVYPATGHSTVEDKGYSATCTTPGLTDGTHCSTCDEILEKQKVIPITHTPITIMGNPATCTESGLTDGSMCGSCGKVLVPQTVIPALGHSEFVDKGYSATCTETGLTDGAHCGVCNTITVAQDVIPATGHTVETVEGYSPTCDTEGLSNGSHCTTCGTVISTQETLDELGHTYVDGTCKVCGYSEEMVLLAETQTYNLSGILNYNSMGNSDVYFRTDDSVMGNTVRMPSNLKVECTGTVIGEDGLEYPYTIYMNNGKFLLNDIPVNSNVKYAIKGDYVYVNFPMDSLIIDGFNFKGATKITNCNISWAVQREDDNGDMLTLSYVYEPLSVTKYDGTYENEMTKQENGLYSYKFASQGDYIMNTPVSLVKGETLVCDFTLSADGFSENGWFGVVFGDGIESKNYPHTEFGMRCYDHNSVTYMFDEEVIVRDTSRNITDVFKDKTSYRIALTHNEDDTYSYVLYERGLNYVPGYFVIDEYLNFTCPNPSSLMLATHSQPGVEVANTFTLTDLVFYKTV